jgi:hypothetical protein
MDWLQYICILIKIDLITQRRWAWRSVEENTMNLWNLFYWLGMNNG